MYTLNDSLSPPTNKRVRAPQVLHTGGGHPSTESHSSDDGATSAKLVWLRPTVAGQRSKSRNKVSVGEPAEGSLPIGFFLAFLCELCCPVEQVSTGWGFVRFSRGREWQSKKGSSVSLAPFKLFFNHSTVLSSLQDKQKKLTTSNGGPLGSCIDEERSKLRYVV